MTTLIAEAGARPAAEDKEALFAALATRFGDRLSRSQALREQHANTLTWLKVQAPDAVLFAETATGARRSQMRRRPCCCSGSTPWRPTPSAGG